MNTRQIALISIMTAATATVAFGKGLALSYLPGLVEFTSVIIFVNGFCFGYYVGAAIGALAMILMLIVPAPFAHPAAWIFTISPVLLVVEAALGAMFGVIGSFLGKMWRQRKVDATFIFVMGILGFVTTFIYQILSSVGFFLAYPVYPSVWDAVYFTFIPGFLPYPPIIHAFTNIVVFAIVAPPLILAIRKLPI